MVESIILVTREATSQTIFFKYAMYFPRALLYQPHRSILDYVDTFESLENVSLFCSFCSLQFQFKYRKRHHATDFILLS